MKRGVVTLAILVFSVQATGQLDAQENPPSWNDGFSPQVDEYEVVEGDTLWSISQRIVGDPFLWPKVWSLNPEITNPHWIYPGDRVRFYPPEFDLPSVSDLVAGQMELREDEGPRASVDEISSQTPEPQGPSIEVVDTRPRQRRPAVMRRLLSRFITEKELKEDGELTNATPDKILLSDGDLVFIKFPSSKRPTKGTPIMTYRTTGEVYHPDTDDFEGYVTQLTGILRVESNQNESVTKARILQTLHEVERGQHVTVMREDPRVLLVKVPAKKEVKGKVMAVRYGSDLIAGDHEVVFIDRGKKHGIERGNQLRVIGVGDPLDDDEESAFTYPIGVLQVADVRERTATCIVVGAKREIEAGARVETIVEPVRAGAENAPPTRSPG